MGADGRHFFLIHFLYDTLQYTRFRCTPGIWVCARLGNSRATPARSASPMYQDCFVALLDYSQDPQSRLRVQLGESRTDGTGVHAKFEEELGWSTPAHRPQRGVKRRSFRTVCAQPVHRSFVFTELSDGTRSTTPKHVSNLQTGLCLHEEAVDIDMHCTWDAWENPVRPSWAVTLPRVVEFRVRSGVDPMPFLQGPYCLVFWVSAS